MEIKAGDLVEVRSREEVLATLDEQGCLDGLPFMPEMLPFCGRRFRVQAVAHKTCDTVFNRGGLRVRNALHLEELRCDGSAHGGCQASCLLFWKTSWVRKISERLPATSSPSIHSPNPPRGVCTGATLDANTAMGIDAHGKPVYSCQATRLPNASERMPPWCLWQYVRDFRSGNVSLRRLSRVLLLSSFRWWADTGVAYRLARPIYDFVHRALTGRPAPIVEGEVADGQVTPVAHLGLKPGEWVRIKPAREIFQTLSRESKNRGLWFDEEMLQHCGKSFRVSGSVERIIHERTGEMIQMRTPCIVLDGGYCTASYTRLRLLCPRRIISYWREIWLERIPEPAARSGVGTAEQ
jgi:hypothetical protein